VFAAVHVFWAVGGRAGLASSAGAALASRRPVVFVVFGLWGVAAALVAAAVLVGWSARAEPARRYRVACGWVLGVVGLGLLARGLLVELALAVDAGGVRDSVGAAESRWSLVLWDPWFVVGGVLFVGVALGLAGSGVGGGAGHLEGPGDEGELEREAAEGDGAGPG
jgi:hypothetical protein